MKLSMARRTECYADTTDRHLALTGVALQRFGPLVTVAAIGAVQFVMATLTALNPHVRHARPIEELQSA